MKHRKRRPPRPPIWAFILLAATSTAAEDPGAEDPFGGEVEVTLIARHKTVRDASTVRVAVLFQMADEWHIYWQNPGDSGLAPEIKWTLPNGFKISKLIWPAPHRLPAEPLMMYGYDGRCLLAADVKVPRGFRGAAKIKASVSWLVCKDVCLSGKRDLSVTLNVGQQEPTVDARWKADFARHDRLMPGPSAKGAFRAIARDGRIRLAVHRAALGKKLSADPKPGFFPGVEEMLNNAAPQKVKLTDGDVFLTLTPARGGARKRLQGVFVAHTAAGRRAWRVDVPVERKKKIAAKKKETSR